MGHHLELQDHDMIFNQLTSKPIIVNNILDTLETEKNAFDSNFLTTYNDTDLLDTIPKCPCGVTQGAHHVDRNGKGTICPACKLEVQPMLDKPLEPIIWVQAPKGVDRLINPQAWRLMSNFYSISNNSNSKLNLIKYLTNTDYHPNRAHHGRWMDEIERLGIERSLNYFYENFDDIIIAISSFAPFTANKDKKSQLKDMLTFISMYRDRIFSEYLPVHNKTIMVIENTKFGTYMDTTLKTIVDAVRNITGIDSPVKDFTIPQKENRCSKLSESISDFGQDHEKTFLSGKPGLIRKHVFANRCFWSGRGVITANAGIHRHDEVHMPWAMAVTLFRIHLFGMLYRRGFGHNDASYYLNAHTHVYSTLLDELFRELIDGSPYDGIPLVIGRNPSMYRTSIQRMFITKIKTDPSIYSIDYPITAVTGPNADFDGDQMFLFLTLDNWTTDELRYLAPHHGAWELSAPRKIGGNMPLPKPLVASVVTQLYNYAPNERNADPVKMRKMEDMFTIREYNGS